MHTSLSIILVVVSIGMMTTILLQQRGASLGGAFGAGSGIYRSRRGVEKVLFRFTIILAVVFIGLTVALLFI